MSDDPTARVAQIREQHHEAPWRYVDAQEQDPRPCYGCGHPWPCETDFLLNHFASAERAAQAASRWRNQHDPGSLHALSDAITAYDAS